MGLIRHPLPPLPATTEDPLNEATFTPTHRYRKKDPMPTDKQSNNYPEHHDFNDPAGADLAQRARELGQKMPGCKWCEERRELLPMAGIAWGFVHHHEPHCRLHDDNALAPVLDESNHLDPYEELRDLRDNPDQSDASPDA